VEWDTTSTGTHRHCMTGCTFRKAPHRDGRIEISAPQLSLSTWPKFRPTNFRMGILCTFSLLSTRQHQEGELHKSQRAPQANSGALDLSVQYVRDAIKERTLFHAVSHRKTAEHLCSVETVTHMTLECIKFKPLFE